MLLHVHADMSWLCTVRSNIFMLGLTAYWTRAGVAIATLSFPGSSLWQESGVQRPGWISPTSTRSRETWKHGEPEVGLIFYGPIQASYFWVRNAKLLGPTLCVSEASGLLLCEIKEETRKNTIFVGLVHTDACFQYHA